MPSWRKVIVSGSDAVLNSVTASFLGNLTGTSSFATTASFANLASCTNQIKVVNWDQPDPGQVFYYTQVLSLANTCQTPTTLDTFGLHYESNTGLHYLDTGLTVTGSIIATTGFTGNLTGTASFATSASYARTASFVTPLNQNVIITGSAVVGSTSLGASENTLTLGPAPAGGAGEGGQLGLNATGGTYTSASFIDNWQNQIRILRGSNAGSDAQLFAVNLHSGQLTFSRYTGSGAFSGTVAATLGVDSSGNVITSAAGSSLTGGATNYIARWASATTLTTGSLFDNGSSVGVGTTSPAYTLDVTGNIRATGAIYANANGALYFQGGDDVGLHDINVANTLGVYGAQDSTVASIKLGSGGGIISGKSSRIGIGTINPVSGTLEVSGNVFATSFTGSLFGTASFAVTAATASTADNFYVRGNVGVGTVPNTSHQLDIASTKGGVNESGIRVLFPAGGGLLNTEFGALAYRDGAWSAVYGKQGSATAAGYFDGNVGIGSTNINSRLEVNPGGNYVTLRVNNSATGTDGEIFQRWAYLNSSNAYYLDLKQTVTSSVVRYNFSMVNDSTTFNDVLVLDRGNVGIGITTPTQKLEVQGSAKIGNDNTPSVSLLLARKNTNQAQVNYFIPSAESPNYQWIEGGYWTGEQAGVSVANNSGKPYYESYVPAGGVKNFGFINQTTSGSSFTSTAITASMTLYQSGTVVLVPNLGNVGIGTASPAAKLHVSGGIYLGVGNANIRYRSSTNWDYYLDNTNDDFRIYDSNTTYFFEAVYNGGSTNKFARILNTLNVRNNGRVGIGTSNPAETLTILGNVSASSYTGSLFGTASFATSASAAITSSFAHRTKLADSASYVFLTYDTTPAQGTQYWLAGATTYGSSYTGLLSDDRLVYYADTKVLYSPSFSGSFTGSFSGSVTSASYAPNFANTNLSLNNDRTHNLSGNNLTFTATSDESITFNHSSGGTFEINGSPTIQTTGQLLHSINNATGNIGIGTQTTTARLHVSGTAGTLLRVQNGSESALMVSSSGVVGIGLTNPFSTLHVRTSVNEGTIAVGNAIYPGLLYANAGTGEFRIDNRGSSAGGYITFYPNGQNTALGNEAMRINTNRNIGIGTTNPSTKLHLYEAGASDVIFRITPADGDYDPVIQFTGQGNDITSEGFEIWYDNSVGDVHLVTTYPNDDAAIRFHTRTGASKSTTNERLTIAGGGNVGIGSTVPSQKLDVNGAIRATLSSVNQANFAMYNSSTGLLTYLPTSSFTPVSASYAVSSSFSTFAATANFANSAGTATNSDYAYVEDTTDNVNYSLVLAEPVHNEYERLKADSNNASYNPSTGTLTAVRLVETSALKFKDNIVPLGSTLDQVLKLRGVSFTKKNTGEQQIGFIADEINEVYPQLVTKDKEGDVYGLSYQRMTAVLLESVKDLNAKIDAQNLFIMDLLKRIETLENK